MKAGKLRHRVEVLKPGTGGRGRFGATSSSFGVHCTVWAEFIHQRGDVAVEGGRAAGRSSLKVRMRSSPDTRAIKPQDHVKNVRTGDVFEVQEVDAITQRADVFLIVEGPLSAVADV